MKLSVAAAAIAFSGTALMFAPAAASAAPVQGKPESSAKLGFDGGFAKAGFSDSGFGKSGMTGKTGMESAKLGTLDHDGMGGPVEDASGIDGADVNSKLAGADMGAKAGMDGMDGGAKFQTASMDMGGKALSGKGDAGGKLAMTGKAGFGDDAHLASKQVSDRDSSQPIETAAVAKDPAASGAGKESYAGMGGPEEAAAGYPPCSRGPGDDRCIQLYEVGGSAKA